MQGIKWGGLLPISNFGSQHYCGVATVRATACKASVPARMTEGQRVSERPCLGRPVATGFLGCSVVTKDSLSLQRWLTLCRDRDFSVMTRSWAVRAFGVATLFWCHNKGVELLGWFCVSTQSLCHDSGVRTGTIEESCRDREFSVVIKKSLSRQSF